MLRAQRVSERLVELGRPALSRDEVRALARRIAQEGGYDKVFDRSQKYFWAALLEEFAGGETLPARDLLYLLEVFSESYGVRLQGWQAGLSAMVARRIDSGTISQDRKFDLHRKFDLLGSIADVSWYKNFSLEHQLSAGVDAWYRGLEREPGFGFGSSRFRHARARVDDLLLLTDRWQWTNSVLTAIDSVQRQNGGEWESLLSVAVNTGLIVFIEDRLSLRPSARLAYRSDEDHELWSWSVGLTLNYQLGQSVY